MGSCYAAPDLAAKELGWKARAPAGRTACGVKCGPAAGERARALTPPARAVAQAKRNIDDMCRDQWKWASANPYGYAGKE